MHQTWCPAHPNNLPECQCFRPYVEIEHPFDAIVRAHEERERQQRKAELDELCKANYYTTCPESLK